VDATNSEECRCTDGASGQVCPANHK
jgi:hypothetical protein